MGNYTGQRFCCPVCHLHYDNNKNIHMFNLDKFISDSVTFRPSSMFEPDIKANAETLTQEIKGKKVCIIGGANMT